jgi:hypothetical protein
LIWVLLPAIPTHGLGAAQTIFPKLILSKICHNLTDISRIFVRNATVAHTIRLNIPPALTADGLARLLVRLCSNRELLVKSFSKSN